MFTGLVETTGTLSALTQSPNGARLKISTTLSPLVLGESIAVQGVCLTVTTHDAAGFTADASLETLQKTTLGQLAVGSPVHLERSLTLGTRLGGHLVSGHVDGVGRIVRKAALGEALEVEFEVPTHLGAFLAPKGSVTVDGVSLTINRSVANRFVVALVPHTQSVTSLTTLAVGAMVNIEVDLLAKYVARLLGLPGVDGSENKITLDLLKKAGFA